MLSDKNNEPNKQNNTFKSYILPEIKYFMVFGIVSKTNIVSKKLMLDAQRKMKNLTVQIPDIDLDSIYYLLEVIE